MLVSLFLPWFSSSSSFDGSQFGIDVQTGGSASWNALQMPGGSIIAICALGCALLSFLRHKVALWAGIVALLLGANQWFGVVGLASVSYSGFGSSLESGNEYGLYVFMGCAVLHTIFGFGGLNNIKTASAIISGSQPTDHGNAPLVKLLPLLRIYKKQRFWVLGLGAASLLITAYFKFVHIPEQ